MSDTEERSFTTQVIGSLVTAALIVAITIATVTANLGQGYDARELREIQERREERQERREEIREDGEGPG